MRESKSENRRSSPESIEPGIVPGWGWGGQRSLEERSEVEPSKKSMGGEAGMFLFCLFLTIQICFIWQ